MKKLLLSLLAFMLLAATSYAQNPPSACNAAFTLQYLSGTTAIKFIPAFTGTATTTSHGWSFGDGSTSNEVSPQHSYTAAGGYTVSHIVVVMNGGAVVCTDTARMFVQSQGSTCNLVVGFNILTTSSPNTFEFLNTSTTAAPTDSIRWTFGDATPPASTFNATHTYANPGTYTVCLKIITRVNGQITSCSREFCQPVTIANPCNLIAEFTSAPGNTANTIFFTNTSQNLNNTDSIKWSFGDGTSSNVFNPIHTYANAGTYNVCLRIQKRNMTGQLTSCVREICHTVTVGTLCNIQAYYTYVATSTTSPSVITFNNASTGLLPTDSITWTFGDGTSDSSSNPVHTYTQGGTYRVCLIIKRVSPVGTAPCIREYCQNISLTAPCNTQASYSYSADPTNPQNIIFTNTSNVPVTATGGVVWNFGDGTSANTFNATHQYATPGRYYVCLRIQTASNCISYRCDSITVASGCFANSQFSFIRSANDNQTFLFRPLRIDGNAIYSWNFGDNTVSQDSTPTHRFNQPGTYNVCLTVTLPAGCSSTTCRMVYVQTPFSCDSVQVIYAYRRDAFMSNKIYFTAIANYPILDQTWTISRSPATPAITIHRFNPTYIFQDTGIYKVCLRTVMAGGCVKDTCQFISVNQVVAPPSTCYLQAYPNPASAQINMNVYLSTPQTIHVYIYNTQNMMVAQNHVPSSAGGNNVSTYVGNLTPGYYFVRVVYGNSVCYSRFQKL